MNFRSPGEKAFQFRVRGCGPNNPDNDFILDYIDLVLATHLERKTWRRRRRRSLFAYRCSYEPAEGTVLNAQMPGDSVAFNVTIPVAGVYDVRLGVRTGDKSGIVQLAIGGANQGAPQDGYSEKLAIRSWTSEG